MQTLLVCLLFFTLQSAAVCCELVTAEMAEVRFSTIAMKKSERRLLSLRPRDVRIAIFGRVCDIIVIVSSMFAIDSLRPSYNQQSYYQKNRFSTCQTKATHLSSADTPSKSDVTTII